MQILIFTDGTEEAIQAATLISRLGVPPEAEVTLLGIQEPGRGRAMLDASMDEMENILGDQYARLERKIRLGKAVEQIILEVEENPYNLIAVGSPSQPHGLVRFRRSSPTTKVLAQKPQTPLLVARAVPDKLEKILVCTSAEPSSLYTLKAGGALISKTGTEIGLLHVMSQIALIPGSPHEDLFDTATSAIRRGTREGKHLKQGMEALRKAGVETPIKPRLRHGLVVDEVLAEIEEGGYDLLVIGAHYHAGQNRWLELFLDDIASQLLDESSLSVLVI